MLWELVRQGTPATQAIRSSCENLGAAALGQWMKVQECMQCNTHSLFQMRKLKARERGSCLCTLGVRNRAAAQLTPLLITCSLAGPLIKAHIATPLGHLPSSQVSSWAGPPPSASMGVLRRGWLSSHVLLI